MAKSKKGPTPKGGFKPEREWQKETPVSVNQPTPLYIPVAAIGSIVAGLIVIILNFLELLPEETQPQYNIVGLVLMTFGFIVATQIK